MKFILWAVGAVVGIYLLMVIPAGIAVLRHEYRFRKSPDRDQVLAIIGDYQLRFKDNEHSVKELVNNGLRETAERDGVKYSVDVSAVEKGVPGQYELRVSVGRFAKVTVGHSEAMALAFGVVK